MTISKAELKRRKQRRQAVEYRILPKLESFHDYYLTSVLNWNLARIEKAATKFEFNSFEDMLTVMEGDNPEAFGLQKKVANYYDSDITMTHNDVHRLWVKMSKARKRLEFKSITTLEIMKETEENYQQKINQLIDKMEVLNFTPHSLEIKELSIHGGQLEILIGEDSRYCPDSKFEFHARTIWAEGMINAPHYRFITTVRGRNEK